MRTVRSKGISCRNGRLNKIAASNAISALSRNIKAAVKRRQPDSIVLINDLSLGKSVSRGRSDKIARQAKKEDF